MTGWIMRHGPHHGAQNSTSTGRSDSRTSDCHVASVTGSTAIVNEQNGLLIVLLMTNNHNQLLSTTATYS
ncbi:hypothetical protein Hanom_Chr10g00940381 [Helianthus anomalus]